jgi:hypothetical protein
VTFSNGSRDKPDIRLPGEGWLGYRGKGFLLAFSLSHVVPYQTKQHLLESLILDPMDMWGLPSGSRIKFGIALTVLVICNDILRCRA